MNLETHLNAEKLPALGEHLGIENAALPKLLPECNAALIAIFREAAADPQKEALVTEYLGGVDQSILEDANALLAEQGKELSKAGRGALAKLLGPRLTDYLAPIAQKTGLGEGKVASALGTLAPLATAVFAQKAKTASELHQLLSDDTTPAIQVEEKAPAREAAPAKSYLPDPDKKKDRRPFPMRKAILLLLLLALLSAAAFFIWSALQNQEEAIPLPPVTTPPTLEETVSLLCIPPFYENHPA